jgi:hypothetical protein
VNGGGRRRWHSHPAAGRGCGSSPTAKRCATASAQFAREGRAQGRGRMPRGRQDVTRAGLCVLIEVAGSEVRAGVRGRADAGMGRPRRPMAGGRRR